MASFLWSTLLSSVLVSGAAGSLVHVSGRSGRMLTALLPADAPEADLAPHTLEPTTEHTPRCNPELTFSEAPEQAERPRGLPHQERSAPSPAQPPAASNRSRRHAPKEYATAPAQPHKGHPATDREPRKQPAVAPEQPGKIQFAEPHEHPFEEEHGVHAPPPTKGKAKDAKQKPHSKGKKSKDDTRRGGKGTHQEIGTYGENRSTGVYGNTGGEYGGAYAGGYGGYGTYGAYTLEDVHSTHDFNAEGLIEDPLEIDVEDGRKGKNKGDEEDGTSREIKGEYGEEEEGGYGDDQGNRGEEKDEPKSHKTTKEHRRKKDDSSDAEGPVQREYLASRRALLL